MNTFTSPEKNLYNGHKTSHNSNKNNNLHSTTIKTNEALCHLFDYFDNDQILKPMRSRVLGALQS